MIKEKLQIEIAKILNFSQKDIHLEHPENFSYGDFSTNIALIKAKELGENPKKLAESFVAKLSARKLSDVSKIEVAGPGFINFHLSRDFFADSIEKIENNKNFGQNNLYKGKKVMVEHTDPNPFKEFHIGHLMTNTIGESIYRLFDTSGAETKNVCYQGDVGLHVAKAIFAKKQKPELPWGAAYKMGSDLYEVYKNEIDEINKKIYDKSDSEINKFYESGRKETLQEFEIIYKKLGTKFDHYFFESETAIFGKKMVEEGLGKGIFENSDGAIIYPGEKHGLHTRVFINKFGIPTYEAKDLGLAKLKYDTFPYDISVSVTGNEINDYFKVVKSALSNIEPELAKKLEHISHGMLRLPIGKMSSRKGNVVTALNFLHNLFDVAKKRASESRVSNSGKIAEQVALAAAKYQILKQSPGKDIIFDFDRSISFEGDSGPYLQYTAVRANSVLEKGSSAGNFLKKILAGKKKIPSEITNVERLLYRLPEIIERACKEYAPQYVVTYLLEVAGAYNAFYGSKQIIGSDYESYYLSITKATRRVMENGLNVLGIKIPQKM
ncbi:MAG: arginine--tRNA ligase [Patescibacteria group bacterium]